MSWNAFFFHHEPNTCLQKVMELRSTHIFFRAILFAQIHDCISHYVRATYATKIFIALQKPVVQSLLFYKFIFVFVLIVCKAVSSQNKERKRRTEKVNTIGLKD